jgi:hypothetical protein
LRDFAKIDDGYRNQLIFDWNSNKMQAQCIFDAFTNRVQWETTFGSDKDPFVAQIFLLQWRMIIDLTGEVRQFLISSPTPVFSDWSAEFIIDFAISFIAVTLLWAIFPAPQIHAFMRS